MVLGREEGAVSVSKKMSATSSPNRASTQVGSSASSKTKVKSGSGSRSVVWGTLMVVVINMVPPSSSMATVYNDSVRGRCVVPMVGRPSVDWPVCRVHELDIVVLLKLLNGAHESVHSL